MLSSLIISEDQSQHRELEESLINDFHVEFLQKIPSNVVELSKIESSFEIIFYLKPVSYSELPSISRLLKSKVMVFQLFDEQNSPVKIEKLLPVAERLQLRASSMRGRIEYYKGVDMINILNAKHIECEGFEVVLNGDANTKVFLGDIVFRVGKNVVFGVRKDNLALFGGDIFSNVAISGFDNGKFVKNLIEVMLGSAEFL